MQLPQDAKPENDPTALWTLQCELLAMAESALGPRDKTKKIYQPSFDDDGPFLRNTPKQDGAFATLSQNAAGYWPTAVFELAHETVHLLNPIAGSANFLEEGTAVEFSIFVLGGLNIPDGRPGNLSEPYTEALRLVRLLPPSVFAAAKNVRLRAGALSNATPRRLEKLFPSVDCATLDKLARSFPLR